MRIRNNYEESILYKINVQIQYAAYFYPFIIIICDVSMLMGPQPQNVE